MVKICSAVDCKKRFQLGSGIKFYRFPQNRERRKLWVKALKRPDWEPTSYSCLCSDHFMSGEAHDDPTHPDYVPSKFTNQTNHEQFKAQAAWEKYNRLVNRLKLIQENKEKQVTTSPPAEPDFSSTEKGPSGSAVLPKAANFKLTPDIASSAKTLRPSPKKSSKSPKVGKLHKISSATKAGFVTGVRRSTAGVQTEMSSGDIMAYVMECTNLREENSKLKQQLSVYEFSEASMLKDEAKAELYTGFKPAALKSLLDMVKDELRSDECCKFSKFQRLILTLMKLRMAYSNLDLAYRFSAVGSTICRTISETLAVLHSKTKHFAASFNRLEFPASSTFVVDFLEVSTDVPTNPQIKAHLWSEQKLRCTVKFLLAMTECGKVVYVSRSRGGSNTDSKLLEEGGLVNLLWPGDKIWALRRLAVKDEFGACRIKVVAPPLTGEKNELEEREFPGTKELTTIQICTRKVIANLKNTFAFLKGTLPNEIVAPPKDSNGDSDADKIVSICCALYNLKRMQSTSTDESNGDEQKMADLDT